jgi:uncharacterized protein (TIGR02147 family)
LPIKGFFWGQLPCAGPLAGRRCHRATNCQRCVAFMIYFYMFCVYYRRMPELPIKNSIHPIEIVKNAYLEKRKVNAQYSLTAFARDLDLSVSFLSRLFRGERSLTVNQTIQIGTLLGLSSEQIEDSIQELVQTASANSKISKKFAHAIYQKKSKTPLPTISYYEVERFKAIREWYHLAILNLTLVKDFNPSPIHIAKRLGISRVEAEDAVHRLLALGLLERRDGKLKKTHQALYIKTMKSERAVREFIEQTMKRATHALQDSSQEAFELRCMPGTTLPIKLSKLPELKEKIIKFQLEIIAAAKAESYDEVYHLNLHLFPLTQPSPAHLPKKENLK